MKTTTLPLRLNRSPLRAFLLIPFVLGCFGLSPQARAVCQEGCDTTNFNTFFGEDALLNHNGVSNTAVGWHALKNNGFSWNTAIGTGALEFNTSGYDNTATGVAALGDNTGGHSNTATGSSTLEFNTTGSDNTATGFSALGSNKTGNGNVANGMWALSGNKTGGRNTATGYSALTSNTAGDNNTATGYGALSSNKTGKNNIALGFSAGANLTRGNGNIDIGNLGVADESRTIRIGTAGNQSNAYIAGISGIAVPVGVGVIIDTDGHLGTVVSSERFKDNIKPMDKASEAILALKPVRFHYKKELDPDGIPQFGLVAEEVAKVDPGLVARDREGKPYTVRYEAVNVMLLNEFLKEHQTVEGQNRKMQKLETTVAEQQATNAQQQKEIQILTASLKEQAAQIQKVSAQLETARPASRVVLAGD